MLYFRYTMDLTDLKKLLENKPSFTVLTDDMLIGEYLPGFSTKDLGNSDRDGAEHLVFFTNDGKNVVKFATGEMLEEGTDLGEVRFERFILEAKLPNSPLLAKSIAVSNIFSVEVRKDMDLEEMMKSPYRRLPPLHSRIAICRDIFKGLELIHNEGLVHLDIKPANIFIDNDMSVSIGDFGFMARSDSDNLQGHKIYGPPDVSKRRGINIDIYAAAMTCIEVIQWERSNYCFKKLQSALFNAPKLDKMCKILSMLFSCNCLDEFAQIEKVIPEVTEQLKCAIVGKECDSSCDNSASKISEIFGKIVEKMVENGIEEPILQKIDWSKCLESAMK